MSVLYSPMITETQRKANAKHKAISKLGPVERPALPAPFAALVEAVKAEALPIDGDEGWVGRQKQLYPPLKPKPMWFSPEDDGCAPSSPKVEDIQRAVCRRYGVSRADMLSARRTATIVLPRQIAMYLAKTITLRSLPEIGRRFGGRDHTTVLHAVRKIEALTSKDVDGIGGDIEMLKKVLQEPV
jgi:hypothetical protein